jgi:hypothetical protein
MSPLSQRRAASLQVFGEVRHATLAGKVLPARARANTSGKFPTVISLTDAQLTALPLMHRDQFLQNVAARLADEPSDDAVMQAINSVFDRIPIFLA